ncbi:MAG: DUF1552 domain-containing protein [Pseudomonadota bacterium]
MNRRIFLRGLGGAVVAAPFLASLASRRAKAQSVAPPKRLIVMFTHYGCITNRFFPAKSHGPLTAADLLSTTLAPLAPYVGKLLIPRGIRTMNEWTAGLLRGQGNDTYGQASGSYFTCQPLTPNSDNPFDFSPSVKFPPLAMGPSLDHVMAQQLSPKGTPLLMRVGNVTDGPQSAISYSAASTIFAGVGQPTPVFSALTGLFQAGPMSPDSYQAARGKSVIDLVRDDLDTLSRLDMSNSDKQKLQAWTDLLHETGMAIGPECSQDTATRQGATQANVDAVSHGAFGEDVLTAQISDGLDGADVHSALAVLAAACNSNPIIFLKYPPNYLFKGLGLSTQAGGLATRIGTAEMVGTCMPGVIDMLLQIDAYYTRKFAKLVGLLDSIPEADGSTILDNSAAVWFQEVSDGCARNHNNIPIIQAGSAGGYFKTGWTVNVDGGSATLSNGNSESVCTPETSDKVDGTKQSTGTDPTLANAPVNKYYCNLMNALGVKAGEDGFPAVGGTAEVIKFGMYDKTEDFIHGDINPHVIHDPGEFTALKANA